MLKNVTLIILSITLSVVHYSQTGPKISVQIESSVQESPAKITLKWKVHSSATGFKIYRKLKSGNSWGAVIATLTPTDSTYEDATVSIGTSYEYKVEKLGSSKGYGYINTGIKVSSAHIENKGKFIIVVDTTHLADFDWELGQLEQDIRKDGWQVYTIKIDRNDTDVSVKAKIKALYITSPIKFKTVFLLGHVPVPYSGNFAYDGHTNHKGAWPADMFYGEMNSTWGDSFVNETSPSRAINKNIPGDGKWDNTNIPSDIEMQVGRIDFHSMPLFNDSEGVLIRKYLQKNHKYKTKQITTVNKAVIDDNFAGSGEGFSSSGYRNFAPVVGINNVENADYFTTLRANPYIWSYGCGGGSYTSCNGIGTSANFASDSLKSIFTMLFGSYFGDFDAINNFSRAALASGNTLTTVWGGRPQWMFHHMGQGENIGYDVRISQNNSTFYHASTLTNFWRLIVTNFLGDPSLRLHIIAPPKNVVLSHTYSSVNVSWTASTETVFGYNIYKTDSLNGEYTKLNTTPISGTSFVHNTTDFHYYMVRAVKLHNSVSGSYFNLSLGAMASIHPIGITEKTIENTTLFPNPASDFFVLKTQNKIQKIEISSIEGKLVKQIKNSFSQKMDISSLEKGTYLIKIYFGNGVSGLKKLIVK